MESKKINQLATNVAPLSTDLTIIGDPSTGVSKKVTLSQIASIFAGAVDFYANLAAFPASGTLNTIYCAKDTQKLYLWSGSAYVETFPSQAVLNTYQLLSAKGVANGYASLDASGKVPIGELPSSIMEYKGLWSAATNTPTLANGTGDTGDVYICSAAGSVNFGAGAITFAIGDYVIYSGTIWQRSSGAVGTVTSVGLSSATSGVTIGSTPITTSGTITLAIATATTSQNGLLSSTDWATFNAKQSALTFSSPLVNTSGTISIPAATTSVNGYLASADFTTFNNKQNAITLTTTGTSGVATLVGATLNIPNYGSALTGYVPYTGATQDVDLGAFSLNGKSLHIKGTAGNGHLGLKHQSAAATGSANESLIYADSLGDLSWQNANLYLSKFITSANTANRSYTFPNATCNIPDDSLVVHLAGTETITGAKTFSGYTTFTSTVDITSGLTFSNSGFTLVLQPPTLSVNRTVTLPNGTGTLALTSDLSNYVDLTTAQTIGGTKTFTSFTKNDFGVLLNASGNYTAASGYNGFGGTSNGIRVVMGQTAIHDLVFSASTNYTYTFPSATGTIALVGGSGVGTVTSVAALTIGTTGTDLSSSVATSTTTPVITLNVPTASATNRGALSSADWTTFNSKQGTITLTTTGTSGAATFSSNTLNIPNYTITNAVTGTGTTNYLPKFTGTSTIGNSVIQESSNLIGIGMTPFSGYKLNVSGLQRNEGANTILNFGELDANNIYFQALNLVGNTSKGFVWYGTGEYMRIFSDGNVGINTGNTNANYKLDVNGTGRFSDSLGYGAGFGLFPRGQGVTDWYLGKYISSPETLDNAIGSLGVNAWRIGYISGSSFVPTISLFAGGSATFSSSVQADGGSNGFLINQNGGAAGLATYSANTDRAQIAFKYAQNFPASNNYTRVLDIVSTGDATGGGAIRFLTSVNNTAPATSMLIATSGNVGIGTTSPATQLEVTSTTGGIIRLMRNDGSVTNDESLGTLEFYTNDGDGAHIGAYVRGLGADFFNYGRYGALSFGVSKTANTDAVEAMRIDLSGQLGINTTTPTAMLDVNGTGRFSNAVNIFGANLAHAANKTVLSQEGSSNGAYWQSYGANTTTVGKFTLRQYSSDGSVSVIPLSIEPTGAATFSSSVTATSFFESSDSRLKTLIQDNYQTKGIASITPKLYTKNGKVELGYYAQDFVGILDSAVSKGSDDMLSLSYREVHTAKIYALEQEIKELKAKLN